MYQKVRKEISNQIYQQLFVCFDSQIKLLRVSLIERYKDKLKTIIKRDIVNEKFFEQTEQLKVSSEKHFIKKSAEMIIENSGWGDIVEQHRNELQAALSTLTQTIREREMEKLQTLTLKAT